MIHDPCDGAFSEPPESTGSLPQPVAPSLPSGGAAAEDRIAWLTTEPPTTEGPGGRLPDDPRIPNDARVPWGWLDVGLLALVGIGATFLYGIAIVLILAAVSVSPAHLQKSITDSGMVAVVAQILADISLLGYLAIQTRVRFHAPFWRTLGWRSLRTGETPRGVAYAGFIFGGFLLATAVALLDAAFPAKQALPIQALLADRRAAILFMLTAVLVAPVVEETIFRGYLYPVCVRSFGVGGGILATGTMFGLLHSIQLWGGWWQIGFLVLVGIVLTTARAMTGTVVASFLMHVSYNALPVIAYVVATHGFHQAPVVR